jgi:predicted  nucleic acid-binding Zn-ribbon protein
MVAKITSEPASHIDLDATDELPVIDFIEDSADLHAATLVLPPAAVPAGVADLAENLREVENRLHRKSERLAALEAELEDAQATRREQEQRESVLRQQLATTNQNLESLRAEFAARQTDLSGAQTEIDSQRTALAIARREVEQQSNDFRHQAADLLELRKRSERQHESLGRLQGYHGVSEAIIGERDRELQLIDARYAAQLGGLSAQIKSLEAQLVAAQTDAGQTASKLQAELDAAAKRLHSQQEALRVADEQGADLVNQLRLHDASLTSVQAELDQLRANENYARQGAATYHEQVEEISGLQSEVAVARTTALRLEEDLRVAEEQIRRLESDAHASASLLGNLQQSIQRLGDETGSQPMLKSVMTEPAVSALIRQEGGAELVHTLGKRTTVGRTPDNDIQIDTTYISRHHAVVLVSATQCVIEDLNSTNGVLVNGRRINRHMLHDGDAVTIGKTEFRYQKRS